MLGVELSIAGSQRSGKPIVLGSIPAKYIFLRYFVDINI